MPYRSRRYWYGDARLQSRDRHCEVPALVAGAFSCRQQKSPRGATGLPYRGRSARGWGWGTGRPNDQRARAAPLPSRRCRSLAASSPRRISSRTVAARLGMRCSNLKSSNALISSAESITCNRMARGRLASPLSFFIAGPFPPADATANRVKQKAPCACAPKPTGLGSAKPWPPTPMLEGFYLFHVNGAEQHKLLPSAVRPDERAAL